MNTVLLLHNTSAFAWSKKGNLSVKGYLFDRTGVFYESSALIDYFSGISSFSDLEERVSYANGCFSVAFSDENDIWLACDPIRSFPVFYARHKGEWLVSDDPYRLLDEVKPVQSNDLAWMEFMATGYVTGDETLIEGIRQVQAGEILQLKNDDLKRKFFFSYRTNDSADSEYEEMRTRGIEVFNDTFKRFIDSLKGRTVVVPLSGGYDSRLIAVMLKKFKYEKVICVTYGRPDNPEMAISEKVADILGFKWICVDYTDKMISGYLNDKQFNEYFPFASGLVSMFYMQEYFAIRYLKENKLIPDDSIFAPGHTGDFIGGRHLGKNGNLLEFESVGEIAARIFHSMYTYMRPKGRRRERMISRIEKSLEQKFTGESDLAYSIQEDWEYKERLAKFIANSITTYTFFGYGFRLPYWDKNLVSFFKTLPLHMKINKYLYDDVLANEFFEPAGVNFDEELQATEKIMKRQRFKNRIKYLLPQFILRMFLTRLDNLYYNEITREMVDDLARKGRKIKTYNNSYNSLIIQWYLENLTEKISK
ncbi:MAG: asparagine synthase [Bacteroidales bacterium]|nr:asparagine synthase [Bacteroidales bacterium]